MGYSLLIYGGGGECRDMKRGSERGQGRGHWYIYTYILFNDL